MTMKSTSLKLATIALGLIVAASAVQAQNATKQESGDGSLTVAKSGNTLAKTSVGDRAEVRYLTSVNSFSGDVKWNAWRRGHAFVQIIENDSNNNGKPILLINTNGDGNIQDVGRTKKVCGTKVGKGSSISVSASVSGKNVKITAGGCTFTGTADGKSAYIKYGSYANKSAEGSQSVSWTNVNPVPKF